MLYRLDISTFYCLRFSTIAVSDFFVLEIYKNLDFPLSIITSS